MIGIGRHIVEVQRNFYHIFNTEDDFEFDGHDFDHLFNHNECLNVGRLSAKVFHTPGHTPACVSYLIGDTLFVGDTIFMPDIGTARCDFPGGDAHTLYRSIKELLNFPGDTRLFVTIIRLPTVCLYVKPLLRDNVKPTYTSAKEFLRKNLFSCGVRETGHWRCLFC